MNFIFELCNCSSKISSTIICADMQENMQNPSDI